jgi:large subunit ribosomal protein L19
MANLLAKFEEAQIKKAKEERNHPDFSYGDTIRVNVKIVEGSNERIQAYEGLCIAIRNKGLRSSFIVRKMSNGKGVERIFPLYSPRVDSIVLVKRGVVRRAKLYYMRKLKGKAARIVEKRVK